MIETDRIKELIAQEIEGTDIFLVDVTISTSNQISVLLDSWSSVTIDNCVAVSRKIEGSLDREVEDFSLEVSSAGLDQAFLVPDQYKKNVGKAVVVTTLDGIKTSGKMIALTDSGIELECEKKVKVEGKKKKQVIVERTPFLFENIKATKVEISFK